MVWTFKVNVQSMRKIAQIFVCFSESPNFTPALHGHFELLSMFEKFALHILP